MHYFKRIETLVIIVVIIVGAIAFSVMNKAQAPTNEATTNNDAQTVQQLVPDSIVRYQGVDGRTALNLLKANHNIETQSFGGVGEFVKSIDGVEPDSSHFWAFYVNGEQAQVGSDSYITKSSEVIEWKLEKIQ